MQVPQPKHFLLGWIAPAGEKLLEIENRIFSERRIRLYALGIIFAYAFGLFWQISHGRSVFDAAGKPLCIDFCTIWVSGHFAASNDPVRAYDYAAFSAAQTTLVGPHHSGFPPYHFFYPPTFLFFTYPLALMSYFTAFAAWTAGTLAIYLAAIYAISPCWTALMIACTPIVVAENILLGQNGCLTAGLIGLSLVFLERRPALSGTVLALLTYKPQFGVLFPFALAASRNWRAFGMATAASIVLSAGAAAAFGYGSWPAVISSLRARNSGLSTDEGLRLTLQSVFGLFHWAGADAQASWIAHLVIAGIITLIVCAVWAKSIRYPLKGATLCIGLVTVTPYVQIYDLCVLSIAVAFLVKDAVVSGFLPGERSALLMCFVGFFFLLAPVGPLIYGVILALAVRRVIAHPRSFAPIR